MAQWAATSHAIVVCNKKVSEVGILGYRCGTAENMILISGGGGMGSLYRRQEICRFSRVKLEITRIIR